VSGVPIELVAELVRASLAAWRLAGEATCTGDGAVVIDRTGSDRSIRVEPKPHDPMFRWLVTVDGRRRPAVSLLAVLRHVRVALDPDYAATRVRVSVASLRVPPI
jgi:hypothetical protein